MKDLFSKQAGIYAKYRPGYPEDLINYILSFVKEKKYAWDVATGNGQAAKLLAPHFEKVFATDISEKQIGQAAPAPNVEYRPGPAEKSDFPNDRFDLITVAQAYHWFQFKDFEKEAIRVSKSGGIIAIWGYGLIITDSEMLNQSIQYFYTAVVGKYWDPERKYLDESYRTVPFPFQALPSKQFSITVYWSREDLLGYLNTWSSVQHYIEANQKNPVDEFNKELPGIWHDGSKKSFSFPLFLRIGAIKG
jgi:SAM-dependent methyltransferase